MSEETKSKETELQYGIPSVLIPGEIFFNPFISHVQKNLFGIIRNLSKTTRGCWATNRTLGNLINRSKSKISEMINSLERFGYIKIQEKTLTDSSKERRIFENKKGYSVLYEDMVRDFHDYSKEPENNEDLDIFLKKSVIKIIKTYKLKITDVDLGLGKTKPDWIDLELYNKLKKIKDDATPFSETGTPLLGNGNPPSRKREENKDIEIHKEKEPSYEGNATEKTVAKPDEKKPSFIRGNISQEEDKKIHKKNSNQNDWIKIGTGEYAVLNAWNKLPHPAGKHSKLNTDTIKKTATILREMKNGIFGSPSVRNWNHDFLDKHKIDFKLFSEKKWTFREIIKTIEGPVTQMYIHGNWPVKKENLPTKLSDLLYNPLRKTSFFVMCYYNPPKPLQIEKTPDKFPKITEFLIEKGFLPSEDLLNGQWKAYQKNISEIMNWFEENINYKSYFASNTFQDSEIVLRMYAFWILGKDPTGNNFTGPRTIPQELEYWMIGMDNNYFREFVENLSFRCPGCIKGREYDD